MAPWPGLPDMTAVDAANEFGAVDKDGKQLHFKDSKGGVDSEGITLIPGADGRPDSAKGVFIGVERDNEHKKTPRPAILSYDVDAAATDANADGAQDLTATHEWGLLAPLSQFGVTLAKVRRR